MKNENSNTGILLIHDGKSVNHTLQYIAEQDVTHILNGIYKDRQISKKVFHKFVQRGHY